MLQIEWMITEQVIILSLKIQINFFYYWFWNDLANDPVDSTLNSYDLLSLDDRKTSIDVPDFEYDEDYNSLVADKGNKKAWFLNHNWY